MTLGYPIPSSLVNTLVGMGYHNLSTMYTPVVERLELSPEDDGRVEQGLSLYALSF